jgi:hypothetical protein
MEATAPNATANGNFDMRSALSKPRLGRFSIDRFQSTDVHSLTFSDRLAEVVHSILGLLRNAVRGVLYSPADIVCRILGFFGTIVRGVRDLRRGALRQVLDLPSGIPTSAFHLIAQVRHAVTPVELLGS